MINKLITMIMLLGAVNNITIASDGNTPINSDTHLQTTSHLRSTLPKVVIEYQDPITGKKFKRTVDKEMAEHITGHKYYTGDECGLDETYIKCLQYGDRVFDFYSYENNDNISLYDAFPELIVLIIPQLSPLATTKEIVLKLYTKTGGIYHEDINGCKQIGPGDLENTEIVGCMPIICSLSYDDVAVLKLVLIELISTVNTLERKNMSGVGIRYEFTMSGLSMQHTFINDPHKTCVAARTPLFSLLMDKHSRVVVKFNEPESETYMKTKYPDRGQQVRLYKDALDTLLDALNNLCTCK